MKIQERYASSVRSSNLKSHHATTWSDSDVLGAYGIADRRLTDGEGYASKHPLAVPLARLFVSDRSAVAEIHETMCEMIITQSAYMRTRIKRVQAFDMAKAVLAWYRNPSCRVCGGHGFGIIKGTTTLSDSRCHPCDGAGKIQLERAFRSEHRPLLQWAMAKMEGESAIAGPAAMRAISLDL